MVLNIKGKLVGTEKPLIAGILNLTPDSFYDGGKYPDAGAALEACRLMSLQGADFIDIGAVSTRPGAKEVPEEEEIERLRPTLELIRKEMPELVFSIDTASSRTAKLAAEKYGAAMINDISAGDDDPEMLKTVADLQIPFIAGHKQGKPENMQHKPVYKDVVRDIIKYFAKKTEQASLLGINDFIIDPGFGFGKTLAHNYKLLAHLDKFRILEKNILIGISRKSMIYKVLKIQASQALNGTSALHLAALQKGANILRVHDVKEALEIRKLFELLQKGESKEVSTFF